MTNSEKLLSSFSENYFYKELVYADLKFTPIGGTEIELADLIINLEDIILAIQLKERNEKDRTQDKNIEEKWLKKKCKKAKEQIKDTISYITSEKVSFINARGKKTIINPSAEVVPLVVFENDSISEYEHLLRTTLMTAWQLIVCRYMISNLCASSCCPQLKSLNISSGGKCFIRIMDRLIC